MTRLNAGAMTFGLIVLLFGARAQAHDDVKID